MFALRRADKHADWTEAPSPPPICSYNNVFFGFLYWTEKRISVYDPLTDVVSLLVLRRNVKVSGEQFVAGVGLTLVQNANVHCIQCDNMG